MQECVDYGTYRISLREELTCLGTSLLLSGMTAWLLYKNVMGMLVMGIIFPICRSYYKNTQIVKRKKELLLQFKDAMQSVAVALVAGLSIENAWKEALRESQELYGEDSYMVEEMRQMNIGIQMNLPVEQILYDFALRSTCEDILGFAEIFRFAKRSGGDFGKIIQNTIGCISEKIEVEREIDTILSGKKMEQKVMNVVPVCLLIYLNLTAEEFLEPLYGNLFGGCVMTGAFFAYIGALILACRMTNIKM